MKKILLMDDNAALLDRLSTTITKFTVITAKTVEEAVQIVESQDISFFVVDLDLGSELTGEIAYDLIFSKGKSIPAIVFSGTEISDSMNSYLEKKGFSAIISKDDPNKSSSDLIEEEVERILNSCADRILQVKRTVETFAVGENPLLYLGSFRSINEWIRSIEECNHVANDMEEEGELKDLIIQYINRFGKIKSD